MATGVAAVLVARAAVAEGMREGGDPTPQLDVKIAKSRHKNKNREPYSRKSRELALRTHAFRVSPLKDKNKSLNYPDNFQPDRILNDPLRQPVI